jgi:hypothetical protein
MTGVLKNLEEWLSLTETTKRAFASVYALAKNAIHLVHTPSRYSFALKVVFSTSDSHDNIVSNMRVNIRARMPHQQASDFRTLPVAVTIENSRGLKANYQHATTAAELLHLLDKRTDLNAAVLDRFREELKFTKAAKLSDIEMSDEVLEAIGFFI